MDPIYTVWYHKYSMKYRRLIDRLIMHKVERWLFSAVLLACYVYRIATLQSYFVVSYVLAIYTMQVLLRYFTPLGLPDIEDEEEDQYDIQLPQHNEDRPLLRSMSEINVWESWTFALLIATATTFFLIFDLPVYWPFLLSYFVMVIIMTFRRYIRHMQKYGYSWTDFTKR